jgi:hypothetical protein
MGEGMLDIVVPWYHGTHVPRTPAHRPAPEVDRRLVDRTQTGVRIERRLLLVLKALAASHGMSLGDLLEGIVLHAFEGAAPFGPESISRIQALKKVYGLNLDARDSHLLIERSRTPARAKRGGA